MWMRLLAGHRRTKYLLVSIFSCGFLQRQRGFVSSTNSRQKPSAPLVGGTVTPKRVLRRLPAHWQRHYGYKPLLLETLLDSTRFQGTCYRAANWICIGETAGRGEWIDITTHSKQ